MTPKAKNHMPTKASGKAAAEAQLRGFIAKFDRANQSLIRAVRRVLKKKLPTATELVYDNYNFFVIGYSPTPRPSDSVLSIAAGANGVGLCFIRGAQLADPKKLLQGSGNQTRFIRLESAAVLDRPEVKALITAALDRGKPMPADGPGQLVIRSVSGKQRPRRKAVRKPTRRTAAPRTAAAPLPESMVTGKASPAKAAVGDKPVFAYIASLRQPQRGIAERVDALAARTLPGLQRSVKWGMSYYGVGDGWCFCCGGFAGHVKVMFINGAALDPVPPVTPVAMGKTTRGVELESADDLDERQLAAWMKQVAAVPGVGGNRKKG